MTPNEHPGSTETFEKAITVPTGRPEEPAETGDELTDAELDAVAGGGTIITVNVDVKFGSPHRLWAAAASGLLKGLIKGSARPA